MPALPQAIELNSLVPDAPALTVSGLSADSRRIEPGDVFIALAGQASDGHDFAHAAAAAGAVAVVSERMIDALPVPCIVRPHLADEQHQMANVAFGRPSEQLSVAACTGTNGKTSICFQASDLLSRLAVPAGYLGTIGWGLSSASLQPARLTTEDPFTVQHRLSVLENSGARWACLEASSHALDQGRLDGVRIKAAIFSNLTRDHIDYHGSFEAYEEAKALLFARPELELAVACADDPVGARMLARAPNSADRISYGFAPTADVRVRREDNGQVSVSSPWGSGNFSLPGIGDFAVANAAAALTLALWQGASFDAALTALAGLAPVPGRAERVSRCADEPTVVVDYAHTPDALEKILEACRAETHGRLICVVGCGGDRDRGKRPQMAAAACAAANEVWLTSDNPRSEDPIDIVTDMQKGLSPDVPCMVDVDRAGAIDGAISCADPGDLVLIAGKGHEEYQEIDGVRREFSDVAVAKSVLARLYPRPDAVNEIRAGAC
ncbi:MAG: UDP-N-acetylmuramoyl-L-alanyl-D-glutamate--2,6-diaminopimelate ligase [Pseudomonadaceae bacterium]|nr:UDP-N-acetylmuramoyl-L-alanyl-D-glutamate--2,6-diaminopimelate ligase [Pseudomonadaceae bacterium]